MQHFTVGVEEQDEAVKHALHHACRSIFTLRKNLCMVLTEAAGAAAGAEGTAVAAAGSDAAAETFLGAGLSACDAVTVGFSCWLAVVTASAPSMPAVTAQLVHQTKDKWDITD